MAEHEFNFVTQGEDPSTGNANFWDELFLLKVTYSSLTFDHFCMKKQIAFNIYCFCRENVYVTFFHFNSR